MNDFGYACRSAIRRPGFTLLVALTLALGFGVNSAVFALVDAVLLRPLPYRDPARLVFVWQTLPQHNVFELEATPFDYDAWRSLRSLSEIGMIAYGSFTLTGDAEDPERVRGTRVTASLMPLLGLSPTIGRGFTTAEDLDDAPAAAILSDGLWRRRYGADPSIVGRAIQIDGLPSTVVGIMPRRASLPGRLDENQLWLPMRMTPDERTTEIRHSYTILARLADGIGFEQATAELQAHAARMAAERPSHHGVGARLGPVTERAVRAIRPTLLVAAASVGLLLLVAAANASTLIVARASNRRHELAVRAALGATRRQLLSLALAEGVVLAALGGAAGLVLGRWTLLAITSLFASSLPQSLTIEVGSRAALLTIALSAAIGVAFGVVAAYRPGQGLAGALSSSRRLTHSAGRMRQALVVAQIALAVVLLSGAGLMLKTVVKLSRVGPGFDPDRVLTLRVALTGSRYATAPARIAFVSTLLERLMRMPSVRGAAATSLVPFSGMRGANGVEIEGHVRGANELSIIIDQRYVSSAYFQTMRIPLVTGRLLTDRDDSRSERVTVINRTMAARYFPNENPLNRRVRTTAGFDSNIWFRIVGVVQDVRHVALSGDAVPEMYHPIEQTAVPTFTVVMRTAGDPGAATPAARAAVRAVDPDLPIYEVSSMEDLIAVSFAQTRTTMLLLSATAVLAAALAAVAIYGAIWYSVVQRTPEIGIRLALGASPSSIFRRVVGSAVALAGTGAALGSAGALAAGPLVRGLLFDTRTTDPFTHGAVVAGAIALAIGASIAPAVHAMRIDPIVALRAD